MNHVAIRVQTLEQSENRTKSVMPELAERKVEEAERATVCIMEDMTVNNKAGVSIVLEMPDGTVATKFLTEGNFKNIIAAFNGALDNFELEKAKRN